MRKLDEDHGHAPKPSTVWEHLDDFVIVLALLAAVGFGIVFVPRFIGARTQSAKNACINNLRQINGAIQQWALENGKTPTNHVVWPDITPYLKSRIICESGGGKYTITCVEDVPRCSIMRHNFDFGNVFVTDDSGSPLSNALVSLKDGNAEVFFVRTGTNGEAWVWNEFRNSGLDMLEGVPDGSKVMTAALQGYRTQMVVLPTNGWPISFKLVRLGN